MRGRYPLPETPRGWLLLGVGVALVWGADRVLGPVAGAVALIVVSGVAVIAAMPWRPGR